MKEIRLSQHGKNKGKYVTLVDDDMFEYLNQWKWCIQPAGIKIYVARREYNDAPKTIKMHRLIMNTPDNMEVDHIDHDGLNNQKSNLRNCFHIENSRNKSSCGSSRYLGVSPYGRKRGYTKFSAYIYVDKKKLHIGYYKDEKEAAFAYDVMAKKYYGEFANLNFK